MKTVGASRLRAILSSSSSLIGAGCIVAGCVLAACGGASSAQIPADFSGVGTLQVGGVTIESAGAVAPSTPAEFLASSYALQAAGDLTGALEILISDAPWPSPALRAARAVRVFNLRNDVADFAAIVSDWAEQPLALDAHPVERLYRNEISAVLTYRAHRYAMQNGIADRSGYGVASRWQFVGPVSPYDVLDFGERLDPDGVENLSQLSDGAGSDSAESGGAQWIVPSATGLNVPVAAEGVYYLESFMTVDRPGEFLFAAASDARFDVRVDGVSVLSHGPEDTWTPPQRLTRVSLSAGTHRVLVQFASDGYANGLWSRWIPLDGASITAFDATHEARADGSVVSAGTSHGVGLSDLWPTNDGTELAWLMDAEMTWLSNDVVRAERLFEGAPSVEQPWIALWRSNLADILAQHPPTLRTDLRISALRPALGGDARSAGVAIELAEVLFEEDQASAAQELLEATALFAPESFQLHRQLADIYDEEGWAELAQSELRRAATLFPDHCPTVQDLIALRVQRAETIAPETLPPEWTVCDSTLRELSERYYRPRGEWDEALRIAELLASRNPDSRQHVLRWLDIAYAAGDTASHDAATAMASSYAFDPVSIAQFALASAVASGDEVAISDDLRALQELSPANLQTLQLTSFVEGANVAPDLRRAGLSAIAEYEDDAPGYTDNAVYVLDYMAERYFEDGSGLRVVHQIVQPLSRDALAAYGEVGAPSDALILTVRTVKADGTTLAPESLGDRAAISMPNLEVGDYIELEYIQAFGPRFADRVTAESGRFYFQVGDGTLYESEVRYIVPDAWMDDVIFDVRAAEITPSVEQLDGAVATTFAMRNIAPVTGDPGAVPADEWVPSVMMGYNVTWEELIQMYDNLIQRYTQATPTMVAEARDLIAGTRSDVEAARRLFRFVNDDFIDYGAFFSEPVAYGWAMGEADRLALLYTLLRAVDLNPEVVFVRPHDADQTELVVPDAYVYDITALRLSGRSETWMEPQFDDYPFGYLRAEAQGADGIIITGPDSGAHLETPLEPFDVEAHRIDMRLTLAPDGSASGEADEALSLRGGTGFRSYVRYMEDEAELYQALDQGLSNSFRGARTEQVDIANLDSVDEALRVSYAFTVPTLTEVQGAQLVFDGQLLARALATTYAQWPSRDRDLLVSFPVREVVRVELVAPVGMTFSEAPADIRLDWGPNRFVRTFALADGGQVLIMERTLDLPIQRVAAADYPAFAEYMTAMQDVARIRVVAAP